MDFYDILLAKSLGGEGGGGLSLYTCSINFANNSGETGQGNIYTVGNNVINLISISLPDGETYENDCVVLYDTDYEIYYIEFMLNGIYTVSNTVNCTYSDGVLFITDIDIPSSCTVTFVSE